MTEGGESGLALRVLGELEVVHDGRALGLPPSKKTRALLAYLLLTERAHRRERLTALLWDVADDPRGALRWSLSKLRALVDDEGATRIVADRESIRLEARGAHVDLWEVRQVAARPEEQTTEALERAASRFRGELLEGLELEEFEEFQSWCVALREEARRARAAIASALVARHASDPERAIAPARTLVQLDPADEEARARLVRLLGACGRVREARQQVESGKRALGDALRPTGPLREAERALRDDASRASAAIEAAPPPAPPPIARAMVVRSAVHGLRLVGRERELARVGEILDAARARSRLHVIWIGGEPGVGKSRFLAECMTEARRRGGTAIDGCAYEPERARPYGLWVDALRRVSPATLGPRLASELAPVLAPGGADGAAAGRERLYAAVIEVLHQLAASAAPALLTIDDAQWCDEASAELLHHAARSLRDRPIVLALGARDAELGDNPGLVRTLRALRRDRVVEEVTLGPLDRDATARLARLVAPGSDAETVYRESGGNPLFALEIARAGALDRELAPSLGAVVRDRVERLPAEALEVLRWASVLGATFRVRVLAELVSISTPELLSSLELLERHALIGGVVDLEDPGGTYQFGHEIVQRVVYADVSHPRRRLMHLEAARALDRLRDGDDARAAEVAHHAIRAAEPALAARACEAVARWSARLSAWPSARTLVRRGKRQAEQLAEPARGEISRALDAIAAEIESAAPGAEADPPSSTGFVLPPRR